MSKVDPDRIVAAVQSDEMIGFCTACGAESEDNVEPDARNYRCTQCGEHKVCGAEELLIWLTA